MAEITRPAPGATLDGVIQIFEWDLGGVPVEASWLYAGSSIGGSQYDKRSTGAFNTTSLGQLPTDGSTVHIRLWYRISGAWQFLDQPHLAADSPGLPQVVEPADGATLDGEAQTFRWDFAGYPVESSWLYVGSDVGGSDYAAARTDTSTSITVRGLPTDESTVHARLYFRIIGVWYHVDSQYQAGSVPLPTRDELTRELQRLVGVTADGIIGPLTRAALNRNWLGRSASFDPSFAVRFTNDDDVVRWAQRRLNTRGGLDLVVDGDFGEATEAATIEQLDRGGVVAAESFVSLLDP